MKVCDCVQAHVMIFLCYFNVIDIAWNGVNSFYSILAKTNNLIEHLEHPFSYKSNKVYFCVRNFQNLDIGIKNMSIPTFLISATLFSSNLNVLIESEFLLSSRTWRKSKSMKRMKNFLLNPTSSLCFYQWRRINSMIRLYRKIQKEKKFYNSIHCCFYQQITMFVNIYFFRVRTTTHWLIIPITAHKLCVKNHTICKVITFA